MYFNNLYMLPNDNLQPTFNLHTWLGDFAR